MTQTMLEGTNLPGCTIETDDAHTGFMRDLLSAGGADLSLINGSTEVRKIEVAGDVDSMTLQRLSLAAGSYAVAQA